MLKNRTAIVSGAGSGIGRAVALELAKHSAKVIAVDKNSIDLNTVCKLIESLPESDHCLSFCADVTDSQSVSDLFSAAKRFDDNISMLVNCAGMRADDWIVNMSEERFDRVMSVNAKGTFLMCKYFCQLISTGAVSASSIVNISSACPKIGTSCQSNYNMSKACVEGMTIAIAEDMARFGLRCNAIGPGFVRTPLISDVDKKFIEDFLQRTILKRIAEPEEVAQTIVYLLSDQSSGTTGAIIDVTGGSLQISE